jgi:hypothetical protein
MNDARSVAIGARSPKGSWARSETVSPPTALKTRPDPEALRKSLLE